MSIDERIDTFSYLLGFLSTFAMSVQDPKGMGAFQRLQSLKVRFERGAQTITGLLFEESGGGS